jgi:hypothetical protein
LAEYDKGSDADDSSAASIFPSSERRLSVHLDNGQNPMIKQRGKKSTRSESSSFSSGDQQLGAHPNDDDDDDGDGDDDDGGDDDDDEGGAAENSEEAFEKETDPDVQTRRMEEYLEEMETKDKLPAEDGEADPSKAQLEKLQARTIDSLVESVKVDIGATTSSVQMLYLTSNQAKMFPFHDLPNLLHCLDISPAPKFVIKILDSRIYYHKGKVFDCDGANNLWDGNRCFSYTSEGFEHPSVLFSEVDYESCMQNLARLSHFVNDKLVPLAMRTNALILVENSSCALTTELCRVAARQQQELDGKQLPYTVLCVTTTRDFEATMDREGTLVYSIMRQSARWREEAPAIRKRAYKINGALGVNWYDLDIPRGITHLVVISGYDERVFSQWQSHLLGKLRVEKPTIALSIFHLDKPEEASSYLARGLPLMLIDSRRRDVAITKNMTDEEVIESVRQKAFEFANMLSEVGKPDCFDAGLLAFLHECLCHRKIATSSGQRESLLLWQEISENKEIQTSIKDAATKKSIGSKGEPHKPISSEEHLVEAFTAIYRDVIVSKGLETAKAAEKKQLNEFKDAVNSAKTTGEINKEIKTFAKATNLINPFLAESFDAAELLHRTLCFRPIDINYDVVDFDESPRALLLQVVKGAVFSDAKKAILGLIGSRLQEVAGAKGFGMFSWTLDKEAQISSILKSPLTYSGDLDNFADLQNAIEMVARIDRLPKRNSAQVAGLIREAWDQVDVYTHVCLRNKWHAKFLSVVLLVIPAVISILTVINLNCRESPCGAFQIPDAALRSFIVALSIVASFVSGYVAFSSPVTKWQQLRGAALALESELWKFRTRTGDYTLKDASGANRYTASEKAEDALFSFIEEIREHVMNAGTVSNTAFAAQLRPQVDEPPKNVSLIYKHGQYEEAQVCGTFGTAHMDDNHHTPLRPSEYIKFRLKPQLDFYAQRLPKYERAHTFFELFVVGAAMAGTAMATFGVSSWVAIVTAISAGVTSWAEFSSSETKMTRYSTTISAVSAILLWWNTLAPVERANQANISRLVLECEAAFQSERSSWVTSSMASKSLAKAAELAADDGTSNA